MTTIPFCTLSENSFVRKFSRNSEIRTGSRPSHHFGTGSSNKYQASLEKSKGMMGLGVIVFGLFVKNLPRLQLHTSAILTDQSKGFGYTGHNSYSKLKLFFIISEKKKKKTKINSSYSFTTL